jgi:dipeptidyl aminopeptidase/acylaminoacyl peptidase
VMDPHFLAAYGHTAAEVCGLAGLSGVYDVQAEYDFWREVKGRVPKVMVEVMGGEQNFDRASPQSYVRPDLPPILLIHGDEDRTVPASITTAFHAALQAAGASNDLRIYAGAGHTDYLFAALAGRQTTIVEDLAGFVHGCP